MTPAASIHPESARSSWPPPPPSAIGHASSHHAPAPYTASPHYPFAGSRPNPPATEPPAFPSGLPPYAAARVNELVAQYTAAEAERAQFASAHGAQSQRVLRLYSQAATLARRYAGRGDASPELAEQTKLAQELYSESCRIKDLYARLHAAQVQLLSSLRTQMQQHAQLHGVEARGPPMQASTGGQMHTPAGYGAAAEGAMAPVAQIPANVQRVPAPAQ